jgi:hypothetical protein
MKIIKKRSMGVQIGVVRRTIGMSISEVNKRTGIKKSAKSGLRVSHIASTT